MMPLSLTISAFGPYPDCVTVDFQQFQESGLFLITGPTGSGKTMLFDAIVFSLFGKSSGQMRETDSLRCDHANKDQPTYVEYTFSLHQQIYQIKRSPKYYLEGRKTPKNPTALLTLPDGKLIEGVREVDAKVISLLGVDDKQFKQIAMIAQGEFTKLIMSTSDEREKVLRELFHTECYQKLEEKLKAQLKVYKDKYDVYYCVHAQKYGWLGWAKNGEAAGTEGMALRLEAIKVVIVNKGEAAPGSTSNAYHVSAPNVNYKTHVQSYGWQNFVSNGATSGTVGKSKRLEGIEINLSGLRDAGGIEYKTHVQKIGWQDYVSNGKLSGTSGKALRLEAICIRLTGDVAKKYDVYYRVHAQKYGWLDWAKNGDPAGTSGKGLRLEGIQIIAVEKGSKAPGNTSKPYIS